MSLYTDPETWALETPSGVKYKLKEGCPTADIGDSFAAHEVCIIQASDLVEFLEGCFPQLDVTAAGAMSVVPGKECAGFSGLQAAHFHVAPFDPGKPWLYGTSDYDTYSKFLEVSIDYRGRAGGGGTPQSNTLEDFLDISLECAIETQMLRRRTGITVVSTESTDQKSLWNATTKKWEEAPPGQHFTIPAGTAFTPILAELDDIPLAKHTPTAQWSVKYPKFPWTVLSYLMQVIRPKLGCVNSTTLAPFGDAPPDTIFFAAMSIGKQFSIGSSGKVFATLNLDLKFIEKHIGPNLDGSITVAANGSYTAKGHNWMFRPELNRWDKVLIDGEPAFPSEDLNLLWR